MILLFQGALLTLLYDKGDTLNSNSKVYRNFITIKKMNKTASAIMAGDHFGLKPLVGSLTKTCEGPELL